MRAHCAGIVACWLALRSLRGEELVAGDTDGRAGGRAREALCSCLCLRDSNGAEHTVHSTTASYPPEHQVHRALVVIPALATIAILENRFRIAGLETRAEYYGSGIGHVAAPHKGAIRTASLRLAATFAIQRSLSNRLRESPLRLENIRKLFLSIDITLMLHRARSSGALAGHSIHPAR